MNSDQLMCVIKERFCLSKVATKIYSPDTLPQHACFFPSAFIANTDPSNLPGEHWIVFWLEDAVSSECFDSFGNLPEAYSFNFADFLKRNTEMCTYNNIQFQKRDRATCGYYVLFYLLMKCEKKSISDICNILGSLKSPDDFVYNYILKRFSCI